MVATPSNDVQSLLLLARTHQRSHEDGTYDASSVARCRAMLNKLKKVLPKLLRLISAAPPDQAVDLLRDMCELLELLIHARVCPHAAAVFVDEAKSTSDESGATANQATTTQSFPTIATILLYLVSFYCNEQLVEAQEIVLNVVVQLVVLLQSRDVYASLHFFRDSVELLEDCLLLEECMRRSQDDNDNGIASVACYLNTAIHAFHGSDGPLAASSDAILCGCVDVEDGAAVAMRKQQLKNLLPAIHVSSYRATIILRRCISKLVGELLCVAGSQFTLDQASRRLCLLVEPVLERDVELVSKLDKVSVVGATSRTDVLEVSVGTCELILVLLRVFEASERSIIQLCQAFFKWTSCYGNIPDIGKVTEHVILEIASIIPSISSHGRDELWPQILRWHEQRLRLLIDMPATLMRSSFKLYESLLENAREAAGLAALQLFDASDVEILDECSKGIFVSIAHTLLSAQGTLAPFLKACSREITKVLHRSIQVPRSGSRKRRRGPEFIIRTPRHIENVFEALSTSILGLVFNHEADISQQVSTMILALRVLLPIRPLADRIGRAETQTIIRAIIQRVEELSHSAKLKNDGPDLSIILLIYLNEQEIGRFRTAVDSMLSWIGTDEALIKASNVSDELPPRFIFTLANDCNVYRDLPVDWAPNGLVEWLRKCESYISRVIQLPKRLRQVFFLAAVWKHYRALNFRITGWGESLPGRLFRQLAMTSSPRSTRLSVVSMLPMILAFVDKEQRDLEPYSILVGSIISLLVEICMASAKADPTMTRTCLEGIQSVICLSSSISLVSGDLVGRPSKRTSCCALTVSDPEHMKTLSTLMSKALDPVMILFRDADMIATFRLALLNLTASMLRHLDIDGVPVKQELHLDMLYSSITDTDRAIRRSALRHLRMCVDLHTCTTILLESEATSASLTEQLNAGIGRAFKDHDYLLLESCIEAIGAICNSNSLLDGEYREVLVWGLLQLLFLWINTHNTQVPVSTAVHDQMRRIFVRHNTSWKLLFATYPEELYYPVVNNLLRTGSLQAFTSTYFGAHFDETILLRDSAAYVLPHYIVHRQDDMMRSFIEAFNGAAGEEDVNMDDEISEYYPTSKKTMSALLLDNIEYVLKELIIHQVEAANNENRIKEWEFLFRYLPENSTIRDVISHSPLRLLNLLAWELGGERSGLAKKAFREISQYLSQGKDIPEGDVDSALVMPRQYFLALMTDLGYRLSKRGPNSSVIYRTRAIRSIHRLFGMFNHHTDDNDEAARGALDPFVPKVMAILKVGLYEKHLQESSILAWSAFVRMLTPKALESNFVSIVVSVLPCITGSSQSFNRSHDSIEGHAWSLDQMEPSDSKNGISGGEFSPTATSMTTAVDLLKYLFVEKRSEVRQAFPRVRLFPSVPALDEVYAAFVAEVGDPSRRSLVDFLQHCLPYVTHWDSGVREIVLRELYHALVTRAMELRHLVQAEGDFVDPAVSDILFAVLNVAKTDPSDGIRLLCAKLLGALGAVDGARIPLTVLHTYNSGGTSMKDRGDPRIEYSTKDLACVLIENWLVKELRAAPENTDAVAFSIQELLKFLADLSADPQHSGQNLGGGGGRRGKPHHVSPMPEWIKRRFERKDVLEFVEPYWYTNYSISNKRKARVDTNMSFYEKYSSSYEEWLHSWCRRLIDLSQPPERKIFRACEMVLSTSSQIGRFLLPYLLQNVLRSGRPDVYEEVKREVMAVLKDDGVMDGLSRSSIDVVASKRGRADDASERAFGEYASRHHQCAQTIVSTIDELNEWVWSTEKKRLALSATNRSTAPAHARLGDVPSDLDDQEKENLEEFLKDIPSQALSNAAFKIKAYARALQYFEVYLRQQKPPSKKESGTTSTLLTTLPVDISLVSRHAAYLQQLYSRVDEPDALTGLAALRRLYDAQRSADPSNERGGEPDDQNLSLSYLLHQVVDHEQLAQWEDALACYEQAIQEVHSAEAIRGFYSDVPRGEEDDVNEDNVVALGVVRDPRAIKPALYSGIVQCLIQLGRLESALQHINGIVTQEPQFVGTLYPHALECAWRLSRWDLVSELLNTEQQSSLLSNSLVQGDVSSRLRNLDVSQLSLVRVLHSFHEGDPATFRKNLDEARSEIMGPLAAACAESYQRAYPLLHKLHFLHEAEQGFICLHSSKDDFVAREKRWNEQCPWDARYELLSASLKFRDPILALRRVMLQEAELKAEVSQNWLSYAKIARKEGYIRTANSAVMHAEALDNPYASLEKAKLMVAQDRMYEALQILEPVDIDASKIEFKVEDPHYCAKNLLLATNWMQESGQRQGKKVVERYEAVIKFDPNWEKGYFFLAKYYEYLLSVSHPEAPTATSASSGTRNEEASVNIDSTFHSHLISLMKNYVLALSHGTKHVFQSMPRLLTLWFEYGELLQPGSNKGTSVNKAMRSIEMELSQSTTEQQILTDIAQIMHNATEMLPAYEWLVCFPQVTSRICHPNPVVVEGVKRILLRVLMTYPTQAMWPLLGLSRSLNSQRRNRARDIIAATQRQFVSNDQEEVANSFSEGMRLVEELINLAGHDPANQRKIHVKLTRIRTLILVPVQAGLNTVLPLSGLAPSDDRHAAFMPHSQAHIKAFSDKADVMMTKEKPKRIEVLGTDGHLYPFLCKREKTGDLRKDARMMEFNTMINKLLQKDREGRKRKLRLRTYAVVCLNEESGLMEWVRHTKAMRQLIGQIHKTERGLIQPVRLTHEIKEQFLGMQKKFANNVTMMALFFRHKILGLPVFTPRFHQWFTNNFADPTAWFEARLAFSRSAAVWSMVGHIIGLGDRHGENILIDTTNGECVHVDFDCLFDKGLKLAKPEIVPFRLTPNIIDAFGITGYEGVFRRVCEVTMELLRGNKETLRSVLESFIHDPLVEWGRRGKNAQGQMSANGRSIADIPSDRSKEETRIILKTIDDRLRGIYNLGDAIRPLVSSAHRSLLPENETLPLSVQGQVDKLIHEATSHENLAQMYIGWMPFL